MKHLVLQQLVENIGKEKLGAAVFSSTFEHNQRKASRHRYSLKLKKGSVIAHEPEANQASARATVRMYTDDAVASGLEQIAVVGKELFEALIKTTSLQHIALIKADGKGMGAEKQVIQKRGMMPGSPLFFDEPRLASILYFGAYPEAERPGAVKTFLSVYFDLMKGWLDLKGLTDPLAALAVSPPAPALVQ